MSHAPTNYSDAAQLYLLNAGYEESGSAEQCRAFITACRSLIILLPAVSEKTAVSRVEFSITEVRTQQAMAQEWLSLKQTACSGRSVFRPTEGRW